jgi:cytidylate kinase
MSMTTITISGTPGSGKSTVADLLHERLNLPYVYSGMIFRETAQKHGMSLEEFSRYCENHSDIDRELDDRQVELLQQGNLILEGRLAGWLAYRHHLPAFKIMLEADSTLRAQRIVNREQGDVEERKREMLQREQSEKKRYETYYGIDLSDTTIYDLVIDTSDKTPEEIVEIIIQRLKDTHYL